MTSDEEKFLNEFVQYLVDYCKYSKVSIEGKSRVNRNTITRLYKGLPGSDATLIAMKLAYPNELKEFEELQGLTGEPTRQDEIITGLEKEIESLKRENESLKLVIKERGEMIDMFKKHVGLLLETQDRLREAEKKEKE